MKVIGNLTKDAIIRAAVSEGLTFTQAVGTPVDVDTVATTNIKVTFDSSNNKVVVVYTDQGDTYEGNAVVGTVDPSNNSISFGTPVAFYSGETDNDWFGVTFDSDSNKVVIAYGDVTNSNDGYAVVGTVSGTSISFGTPVAFSTSNNTMIECTFDSSNNKVVIVWKDAGNSNYGTAIVGTVSGTSISFGSAVVFNSNNTSYPRATFDSSNNKVVISYRNQSTTYGTAIVGTVSGTAISFGTAATYNSSATNYQSITFDSTNNKVVIAANRGSGYAVVGTVSGTSISFGSEVQFETGAAEYNNCAFDSNTGKVVIIYNDSNNSNRPTFIAGTVSGTSISFDTAVTAQTETTNGNMGITFDSNAKKIVGTYKDSGGGDNRGEAVVLQTAGSIATGGTIANGSAVIVNANGTVSSVSQSALTEAVGTPVQFEAATSYDQGIAYDSTNNKVVICYRDDGNSSYGTAVVGTVSGDSISFGTAVVFESAYSDFFAPVFDSSNGKIVIAYRDLGDSQKGKAIVGTVSGTSISFGSITEFEAGSTTYISTAFDSSANKVVIAYRDGGDNYGKAIVGTVSDTSISFGSEATFSSATTSHISVAYDVANNKSVIGYYTSSGNAKVATVSGTSISFGSAAEFEAGQTIQTNAVYDSKNEKVHIFYVDGGDNDYGKASIGTVSGTSISFTGQSTFYNSGQISWLGASFNSTVDKITLSFRTSGNDLLVIAVTPSASSYSFGSAFTIDSTISNGRTPNVHDVAAQKTVLAYSDGADSNKGTAAVYTAPGDVTNLTTKNFVGFMDGAALDGTNGEILSSCAIARNQTSLTPGQTYFVSPTDGALSLTAGSPSVTAGTAISSTEIIVKG